MSETTGYEWGHAARLRARRDHLGLGQLEMAVRMGNAAGKPLSRRSYQRMESGEAAIHVSMWETIDKLDSMMLEDVRSLITHAERSTASEVTVMTRSDADGWSRTILARAMHETTSIDPKFSDDLLAAQEMTG